MSRASLRRYFRHGLFPQLVVFEAVARLGGVTRAAEELHLAQPTVSTQLKKLSQALEVRLFEPDGRGLKMTPAGEALRDVCAELFEVLRRGEERLCAFRAPPSASAPACPEAGEMASRLLAVLYFAAAFRRKAPRDGAYNSGEDSGEKEPWKSRASTTRR
jgi:DNA-binding transcriptional LysR family regulator